MLKEGTESVDLKAWIGKELRNSTRLPRFEIKCATCGVNFLGIREAKMCESCSLKMRIKGQNGTKQKRLPKGEGASKGKELKVDSPKIMKG